MAAVLVVWAGVELQNYIKKKEAKKSLKKSRDEQRYEELRAETERRLSGYQAMPGEPVDVEEEEDDDEERRLEQLPSYEQTVAADARRASLTKPEPGETRRRPKALRRRDMAPDPSLREALRSFIRRE